MFGVGPERRSFRCVVIADCGEKTEGPLLDQIFAVAAGEEQRAGTGPDQTQIALCKRVFGVPVAVCGKLLELIVL